MSNNPFGDDDLDSAWGISRPAASDGIQDTLRKEAAMKSAFSLGGFDDH